MSERAQALEAALREIVEDLEARWDMSDPRTNPGIRDNVERACSEEFHGRDVPVNDVCECPRCVAARQVSGKP